MDNIEFDNKLLETYYKLSLDKNEIVVDANLVGKNITEHDLNILLSLKSVKFIGMDLSNLSLNGGNAEKIYIDNCILDNAHFDSMQDDTSDLLKGIYLSNVSLNSRTLTRNGKFKKSKNCGNIKFGSFTRFCFK